MKSKMLIKEVLMTLSTRIGIVLLMFQINSCELEEIPPTDPEASLNTRSNFQFAIQNAECTSNCTVTFTNLSQNADTYLWDFGDATASSALVNPSHIYVNPGSYNVKLTAARGTVKHDTTIAVVINEAEDAPTPVQAFSHTASAANINSQLTTLDNAITNGNPSKIIIVTPVLGLRNTAALGVYYFGSKWMIFTQNTSNIQSGEIFNVMVSDSGASAFVHQVAAGNLRTTYSSTIDHASVNNKPDARIFITPVWEQSTDYNNHAVGVVYINNRWEIINLNKSNLPVGLKFNVIVSTDDLQSFIHTSSATEIIADYTTMDDVKVNSKASVRIIATPNLGTSDAAVKNPAVTGLWYKASAGKWTIFNENGDVMPDGAGYNILAIE